MFFSFLHIRPPAFVSFGATSLAVFMKRYSHGSIRNLQATKLDHAGYGVLAEDPLESIRTRTAKDGLSFIPNQFINRILHLGPMIKVVVVKRSFSPDEVLC